MDSLDMSKDFCHLHVHTVYSILDGINKIKPLAKHVKDSGMSCCAITDHGVMHGAIDWWKAGTDAGIKPIIGVEAYLTTDEDGIEDNKHKTRDNFHCILLAQNETGLRNLYWLTNQANLHNFYYRPRISIEHFKNGRADGIIATSSCIGGVVCQASSIWAPDPETNKVKKMNPCFDAGNKTFKGDKGVIERLGLFRELFQGRFYAEIQDNPEFWEQNAYNQWLIEEARRMSIPLVISADAHWLTKNDKATHDLIMAQQLKCSVQEYRERGDEDGMYYGDGHYIRSPDEMHQAALKYGAEDAFWNTTELAKTVELDIKLGEYKPPLFDIQNESDYEDFKQWRATRFECDGI
jgi:DNA polymerase-3 subunit alpha